MRTLVTVLLSLSILTGIALCDDEAESAEKNVSQSFSMGDLQWMVGKWTGEAFGGTCEELWSQPSGGVMIGTFKLIMGDNAAMYEIMMISVVAGKPELRLKHFNADLTAWEEKDEYVTFPFSGVGDNEVQFDGLTYKREENGLTITVITGDADGNSHTNVIECNKAEL